MPDFVLEEHPLVSVVIPTYNRDELLTETIQTVIGQTYHNWELIIVDDGSTDQTQKVVESITDARIKYYYVTHSENLAKVRNFGIGKSAGKLIAFHDSDDLWRTDKLQVQVDLLLAHPEAAFVISNGSEFGPGSVHKRDYEPLFVGRLFKPMLLETKFPFTVPSFVFRKEALSKTGLMIESKSRLYDIRFFYIMSYWFPGIFTNERLVSVRKHSSSRSANPTGQVYIDSVEMVKTFFDDGWLTRREFATQTSLNYYKLGLHFLRTHKSREALRSFRKSIWFNPMRIKTYVRIAQSVALFAR